MFVSVAFVAFSEGAPGGVGGARVAPRCAVRSEAEAIASRRVLLGVGVGVGVPTSQPGVLHSARPRRSRPGRLHLGRRPCCLHRSRQAKGCQYWTHKRT